MIGAPVIGMVLVCTQPDGAGTLQIGKTYHVIDKTRIGRTWRIEVEEVPDRWFSPERFTESRANG